jgi:hypothetical protein
MSSEFDSRIIEYYTQTAPEDFNLGVLVEELGLTKPEICTIAGLFGLTDRRRPHVLTKHAEEHPNWIGDDIRSPDASRERVRKKYTQLGACERCREVNATDRHHKDSNPFNNVRSNLAFLCRRCHMIEDGRLERFAALPKVEPKPPTPCIVCSKLYKPLRKGRCHSCNEYYRRHGYDRGADHVKAA